MWEAQRLTTRHEQDGKVIRSKKNSCKEIVATWQVTVPLVVKLPEITPLIAQVCWWGMEAAYDVFK